MNIAYIVPNLQQTGPIIVVQSLVKFLANSGNRVTVYYIDECESPIVMGCKTQKIFYDEPFPFDEFDVIHCHTAKSDLYALFWINRMHRSLLVTTIHQDSFYTEKLRLGKINGVFYTHLWLKVQKLFDGQITISKQIKELYQKYFPKEINVIYNGVNCEEGGVDDKGTTWILVQSAKGQKIIDNTVTRLHLIEAPVDVAIKLDGMLAESCTTESPLRNEFFREWQSMDMEMLIEKYYHKNFKQSAKSII